MKQSTITKRILAVGTVSVFALAVVVGLAAPRTFAATSEPCIPIYGEDGQPVTICEPTSTQDTLAPAVNITNPVDSVVKRNRTVLITALATDNVGVVKVELYVNGMLASTSNGSTGSASWTPTERGDYSIFAKAYDAAGNVGSSVQTVTVR